jgi:SAM-dependent methyltransferase
MAKPPLDARAHNRDAWNARAREQAVFTRPATDVELANPLGTLDPRGWFGSDVAGKRVLCLGAGGGRHGPLFAKAGAAVTVVDISPAMLEIDRQMAEKHALRIACIEASIDNLSQLPPCSFDLVVQPVSSCYVPSVVAVYQEVKRVLVTGGTYVSQHKTPTNLQCSTAPSDGRYEVMQPYYLSHPLPAAPNSRFRESGTLEFLHRWEELVGGLVRTGFVLEDLVEVQRGSAGAEVGSFEHRSFYIAPYVRLLARRSPEIVVL